jgi:hypothetical protein
VTFDAIALCRDHPDTAAVVTALLAAGPDLLLDTVEPAGLLQLRHPDGRLLLTTEGVRLVQVPGEARRLLGITAPVPEPGWWVESRAPGHDREAEEVVRRFTRTLVQTAGGVLWTTW